MERLLPGNLLRFFQVGQGSLQTGLLASETNLKAPLLLLLLLAASSGTANKICCFVSRKMMPIGFTVHEMQFQRLVNEVKRTALSRVNAACLRNSILSFEI